MGTFSVSTKGVDLSSSPVEVSLALQGGRSLLDRARIVPKKLLYLLIRLTRFSTDI